MAFLLTLILALGSAAARESATVPPLEAPPPAAMPERLDASDGLYGPVAAHEAAMRVIGARRIDPDAYLELVGIAAAAGCGWDAATAAVIVLRESGGVADALNTANPDGSTDRGLFQLNSIHRSWIGGRWDDLDDPEVNASVACVLWVRAGRSWSPWCLPAYRGHPIRAAGCEGLG